MGDDDRFADRQSQPDSAVSPRPGVVDAVEPLKDVGQMLGGMPIPVSLTTSTTSLGNDRSDTFTWPCSWL